MTDLRELEAEAERLAAQLRATLDRLHQLEAADGRELDLCPPLELEEAWARYGVPLDQELDARCPTRRELPWELPTTQEADHG